MTDPVVVPRSEHPLSRRLIDPDALKVLYRLHEHEYAAYLVGGSVRDLLLDRRPKDFDIGTSAHPYQVKKLFRNCWIIGRRFRLAHVRFGTKNIEVATFRRQLSVEELAAAEAAADAAQEAGPGPDAPHPDHAAHRDNTFGTPEEDAFRRDFTINALFYDIGTFSIIDYTGGLKDLQDRVVRCIGDPNVRFQEDPVRMIRAVSMASRLGFTIDPPIDAAIAAHRDELAKASPARLMEELFKLLRCGAAERAFRMLVERRLLDPIAAEIQRHAGPPLWEALARLDTYRGRFEDAPDSLTNPILLGTMLVPLGIDFRRQPVDLRPDGRPGKEPLLSIGRMALARRDVEHLRHFLALQRRLADLHASPRARIALTHRSSFPEALTWLDIHGQAPELVEHWRGFIEAASSLEGPPPSAEGDVPRRRRRRRRRRRPPSAQG